jgi:hypothetical protein
MALDDASVGAGGDELSRTYCLAEDREDTGLRFAIASLRRHCPATPITVYRDEPSSEFADWIARRPGITLMSRRPNGAESWNCKPHTLIPLLEGEFKEAVWLDSDILVTRDPSPLFDGLPENVLVAAEEAPNMPHQGTEPRTRGWGLPIGRSLPQTVNSCVLRVTRAHLPLLRRWRELLDDPNYRDAQRRPLAERPLHHMSDQDVLNALVGSAEFASYEMRYLRGGVDVLHSGGSAGYSLRLRGRGLFRPTPTFLHAIAGKPWWIFTDEYQRTHPPGYTKLRRLLQEVSPYVREACKYREDVGVDCPWIDARSPLGVGLRIIGLGHFALRGLPLAAVAQAITLVRRNREASL